MIPVKSESHIESQEVLNKDCFVPVEQHNELRKMLADSEEANRRFLEEANRLCLEAEANRRILEVTLKKLADSEEATRNILKAKTVSDASLELLKAEVSRHRGHNPCCTTS
jgi:hypothetical protein